MLGASHRTRSLWQGSQIVEQWRSFQGEDQTQGDQGHQGEHRETVQIDRWHYELGGQSFKPLARESLLPQEMLQGVVSEGEQSPASEEQTVIKSHLYPVISDHLGTPRELYNLKGECVWQAQHELWGRAHIRKAKGYSEHKALTSPTPHSYQSDEDFELPGIDCELRFAGQWEDEESGLHFNFNRYYDPQSGQYLSQDPIGLEGGLRTQGYVADPLTWVDPLGLQACETIRVRHYTNRKGSNAIEEEGVIRARDNNRVYVEPANKKPLSQVEVENKYQIKPGRGRDYVETDVPASSVEWVPNPRYGTPELTVKGDVPLKNPKIDRRR